MWAQVDIRTAFAFAKGLQQNYRPDRNYPPPPRGMPPEACDMVAFADGSFACVVSVMGSSVEELNGEMTTVAYPMKPGFWVWQAEKK